MKKLLPPIRTPTQLKLVAPSEQPGFRRTFRFPTIGEPGPSPNGNGIERQSTPRPRPSLTFGTPSPARKGGNSTGWRRGGIGFATLDGRMGQRAAASPMSQER